MQSVGIILYILFFAGAAGGIWTGLNRNNTKNSKSYVLKSILFFFAGLCFFVSAIKFYLGEAENTLLESFWDAEGRTYLHYGIVFTVISIAAPLLIKRLFSSSGYHLVHTFDSIYAAIIVIGFTMFGRIDNRSYCILYAVCLLAGGIISLYDQNYLRKENMFGGGRTISDQLSSGSCSPRRYRL